MLTQIIFLLALVGIGIYLLRSEPSARHLALRRLTVLIALLAGAVVILSPGWLTAVANLVGVGRGTDLLLYLSILIGILGMAAGAYALRGGLAEGDKVLRFPNATLKDGQVVQTGRGAVAAVVAEK